MPIESPEQARDLPDHVTMPLLTRITQQSLDVDYLHVAQRKAASGEPARPGVRRGTGVVVAVFGLLLVIAAVQTSRNVSIDEQSRASLIALITTKKALISTQDEHIAQLRTEVATDERILESVTNDARSVNAELTRLQVRTGFVAVHGEGLRIVVDDGSGGEEFRVRDEDLAMLVDGLWSAGAEAISINGQRLTALSPIRTSGAAINVNDRPISAPYVVLAIGDTSTLQSRFAETTHGLDFYSLASTLGFQFDMRNEDEVALPAARMPVLRWATTPGAQQDGTDRKQKEGATP